MNVFDLAGGSYWAYKNATEVVVKWIRSAFLCLPRTSRTNLKGRSNKDSLANLSLARLSSMVRSIVEERSHLPPALCKELRVALVACQRAIQQRQRVSQLFREAGPTSEEAKESNVRHSHCISTLQEWHLLLSPLAVVESSEVTAQSSSGWNAEKSLSPGNSKARLRSSLADNGLLFNLKNSFGLLSFDQRNECQSEENECENGQIDKDEEEDNEAGDSHPVTSVEKAVLSSPPLPPLLTIPTITTATTTPAVATTEQRNDQPRKAKTSQERGPPSQASSSSSNTAGNLPKSDEKAASDIDTEGNESDIHGSDNDDNDSSDSILLVDIETEVRFKLGCLILDLEDLMEKVVDVWRDVRANRSSFLTGSTVSAMAIRCVAALESDLLIDYPALSSFEPILHCMRRVFTDKRFLESCKAAPNSRESTLHFLWLTWRILGGFAKVVPQNQTTALILREGKFGPPYDEISSPLHESCLDMQRLLLCELAKMYNFHTDEDGMPFQLFEGNGLKTMAMFISSYADLFSGRSPSLRSVFATAVWMRSVQLIQGDRFLGRTVAVAKIQLWELNRRLTESLIAGEIRAIAPNVESVVLEQCKLTAHTLLANLYRYNPILSGSLFLDISLLHLRVGAHVIACRFTVLHSVLHLYNALKVLRLLASPLPVFELLLVIFGPLFLTDFPCAAGVFLRSALGVIVIGSGVGGDVEEVPHLDDIAGRLSVLYRVFGEGDLTSLPSANSVLQLERIVQLAHEEQVERGIFSFDFFYAFRILGELMATLTDVIFPAAPPHLSSEFLTLLLLNYLDAPLAAEQVLARQMGEVFEALRDFDTETLFTQPRRTSLTEVMFGGYRPEEEHANLETMEVPMLFSELMDMLEEASGPLSIEQIGRFKQHVLQHPALLFLLDPTSELPGIMHHIAAGRAADPCLLEWCVSLGGAACIEASLATTPLHCAVAVGNEVSLKILLTAAPRHHLNLVDTMGDTPMHIAARLGNMSLIKTLLVAGPDLTIKNKRRKTSIDVARSPEARGLLFTALHIQLRDAAQLSVLDSPNQCEKRQKQMQKHSARIYHRTLSQIGLSDVETVDVRKPKARRSNAKRRGKNRSK